MSNSNGFQKKVDDLRARVNNDAADQTAPQRHPEAPQTSVKTDKGQLDLMRQSGSKELETSNRGVLAAAMAEAQEAANTVRKINDKASDVIVAIYENSDAQRAGMLAEKLKAADIVQVETETLNTSDFDGILSGFLSAGGLPPVQLQ